MRLILLAGAIALAACARPSGAPSLAAGVEAPTADALELPGCPRAVPIDSLVKGADWREAEDLGVRFCIPANWRQNRPNVWGTDGIVVVMYVTPSARLDYPQRQIATGRTWGFQMDTVEGHTLEMWAERTRVESGPQRWDAATRSYRSGARFAHASRGYSSYGLYRDANVIFRAWVRKSDDVEITRRIFRTFRLAPTHQDRLRG